MNIIHFEVNQEDRQLLSSLASNIPDLAGAATMEFCRKKLDETVTRACLDAQEKQYRFVGSIIKQPIIDALPSLKLIIARSTGFDNIDVAYAASKGITVCNIPAYGSRTVAEYAFALILGLSRKTFQANFQIKTGGGFDYAGFEGFNLQGKTLGVIGTGRIGLEAIKIAKGFEMNIAAFDLFPDEAKAQQYGFKYMALPELLGLADVVTLHVPTLKTLII